MADAVHLIFVIAFVAAVLGLLSAFFAPHIELTEKEIESETPVLVSLE
jgi:uncharacterized membrane protein